MADVDDLVLSLYALGFADSLDPANRREFITAWAQAILASNWLAAHDREVAAKALRDAAEAWWEKNGSTGGFEAYDFLCSRAAMTAKEAS